MSLAVRPATSEDATELANLLNAIIEAGGTTALEQHFTPEALDNAYLTGPDVQSCVVAIDGEAGRIEGFQTLGKYQDLPDDVADIGTFTRPGRVQRGVGSALFAATRATAVKLGLAEINATIRADNSGGLAFYSKQGFVDHSISRAVPLRDGTQVDRIHKRYSLLGTRQSQ